VKSGTNSGTTNFSYLSARFQRIQVGKCSFFIIIDHLKLFIYLSI